jgi:hypothetical protein
MQKYWFGEKMGFPPEVVERVLVACDRCCCICHKFCGTKIELHHIVQDADGGDNTFDNCIPLCFDCHAEVKAYNPHHPKGRKFTEGELIQHRDKWYLIREANGSNQAKSHNVSITITNAKLQRCSHCGFGYYIDDPLGEFPELTGSAFMQAALIGATTTCPRCGNVDEIDRSVWRI